MYRSGDEWHARVKLIGDAATYVANDQFRGISIGTVLAHDMHGRPVGEALDHLLITNFAKGLVGLFQRKPDGSIECRGLALEDDSHAIAKMAAESVGVKVSKAT